MPQLVLQSDGEPPVRQHPRLRTSASGAGVVCMLVLLLALLGPAAVQADGVADWRTPAAVELELADAGGAHLAEEQLRIGRWARTHPVPEDGAASGSPADSPPAALDPGEEATLESAAKAATSAPRPAGMLCLIESYRGSHRMLHCWVTAPGPATT